ncbi:M48 family metallopeptidase [Photobacterium chitinilyticum]|uniref:M48 family peptidase n=1 Tax=Photobacterium chitinilyticum TaxID=2485123 RepID=A0A444JIJ6_9GAMM|nr:SprT family zinc-dependent metalloprotease [Photobacterium chitinilyticum]RWX52891.1 M48 family peptidase [Photobacterium chitinilyticum]
MTDIKVTPHEQGAFYYGDEILHYHIQRRATDDERKVVIKVHPDERITVMAPKSASKEEVKAAILKRVRWIWESLLEFRQQQEFISPRQYAGGETYFYLGKRYRLKLIQQEETVPSVKLKRGRLEVCYSGEYNAELIKKWVMHWYEHRAYILYHQRLAELLPKTDWVTGLPNLKIMPMTRQWGSCSTSGRIMLNPHLVKAPKDCIDYVILHELCHIAEHNHSDRFWRLLTKVMPDWKANKAKLDEMAELYLNE